MSDELIALIAADEGDPRIQAAVTELREMIARHFPGATFEVVCGEEPEGIHLIPTVDVEDLEEVAAIFEERLIDMQVEEGLPVYVFPDWPIERARAYRQQQLATPVERRSPVMIP